MRHVTNRDRFGREQRASENRQRRVLRTGDANLTLERAPAFDVQFVHDDPGQRRDQRAAASSGVRASMESAWISRPTNSPRQR